MGSLTPLTEGNIFDGRPTFFVCEDSEPPTWAKQLSLKGLGQNSSRYARISAGEFGGRRRRRRSTEEQEEEHGGA
jgi:hypothetical protein